jgi:putative transposase
VSEGLFQPPQLTLTEILLGGPRPANTPQGANRLKLCAGSFRARKDGVMPKRLDPAVKKRALRLLREYRDQYPSLTAACAAVARQERIGAETLRRWMVQAEIDAGTREGITTQAREEIQRLKAENSRLREDVAVLKTATTFFAGELDPHNP